MKWTVFVLLLSLGTGLLFAQERTIGLVEYDESTEEGYYLFSPKSYTSTYLINECGGLIREWESAYKPGNIEYFMPNGNLVVAKETMGFPTLGAGGLGGLFLMYDWDLNLLWEYFVREDSVELAHHEFQPLPNGNLLILVWDWRSGEEALAMGRDTALLAFDFVWPEKILEIRPIFPDSAEIVWEWYQWDHLVQDYDPTKPNFGVVADHPELFDINYTPNTGGDWVHANALDYDPVTDQIIMCSRNNAEFYVIDHSTTTEEAAGHTGGRWGKGGDILFRYGNPRAYEQGDTSDQVFYDAHGANFVDWGIDEAWDMVVFNNGKGRPEGDYTDVLQISPMRDIDSNYIIQDGKFLASHRVVYQADPPESWYSRFLAGAAKISDDKYLISDGPGGTLFEADLDQNITWKYIIPVDGGGALTQGHEFPPIAPGNAFPNFTFRGTKYRADDPIFTGKDLEAESTIELQALPSLCDTDTTSDTTTGIDLNLFVSSISVYPNPVQRGSQLNITNASAYNLKSVALINITSQEIGAVYETSRSYINSFKLPSTLTPGIYLLRFEFDPDVESRLVYRKLVVY